MGTKNDEGAESVGASDRRLDARRKTLKSAKIIFNKRQSVIDCFVRDLSETGAKLMLPDMIPIPKQFKLVLHDGTVHGCEIMRINGKEVGVRFVVGWKE